jgi:Zn-dependent protease
MFSILNHIGPEVPLTIFLLLLLAFRIKVTPRASLWINVTPEKLWPLLAVHDGKLENWGRTTILTELVDSTTQTYRKIFTTTIGNAQSRQFQALFRVTENIENKSVELIRADIEGKSERNELLRLRHKLTPENNGTRLDTVYYWGPRPFLAQLLARADLWGGAYRIKGQAETGVPNERPYQLISSAITLVTMLITFATFVAMIAPYSNILLAAVIGLLLVLALFVHEFGHLLAYKLIGQPWGRMVFLPFLGALAMPRLPFESQGQSVFAALMGPGFSVILGFACAMPYLFGYQLNPIVAGLGLLTAGINLFNLLPAEPLDGGIALRSVLARVIGDKASWGLITIGVLIGALGFYHEQIGLVLFGATAILANIKPRKIDHGLIPLSSLQVCIAAFGYVAIMAAHIKLLQIFISHGNLLNV